MAEWINVSETKPTGYEPVLVTLWAWGQPGVERLCKVAYYCPHESGWREDESSGDDGDIVIIEPTHWQPLPSPPDSQR